MGRHAYFGLWSWHCGSQKERFPDWRLSWCDVAAAQRTPASMQMAVAAVCTSSSRGLALIPVLLRRSMTPWAALQASNQGICFLLAHWFLHTGLMESCIHGYFINLLPSLIAENKQSLPSHVVTVKGFFWRAEILILLHMWIYIHACLMPVHVICGLCMSRYLKQK